MFSNMMEVRESVKDWLMQHGCDINTNDYPQHKALLLACEKDSDEILEQLIQDGVDVDSNNKFGESVVVTACETLRFDDEKTKRSLERLLKYGADINVKNQWKYPVFTIVCMEGKKKTAEFLIQQGVDINFKNKDGFTAMDMACRKKYPEIVELLLENNVSLDIAKGEADYFFTDYACRGGKVELVLSLLEQGIDCNLRDGSAIGEAIYGASTGGTTDVISILFSNGFNLSRPLLNGAHNAFIAGRVDIVHMILDSGVDIDIHYIFLFACSRGHISILERLLKSGIDINRKPNLPRTLTHLMYAVQSWQLETVKWLIEHGANVNLTLENHGNALMYGCTCLEGDIAKVLIDSGIEIHQVRDRFGKTILMNACDNGSYEIAKLLVENWVDIDAQDMDGVTALMYACQKHDLTDSNLDLDVPNFGGFEDYGYKQDEGKAKIIDLLMEQNANFNLQDRRGNTALSYARSNEYSTEETLQKLIEAQLRPKSLLKWCYITISKAISLSFPSSSKKQLIQMLLIPETLKKRLTFTVVD